jgi:hypothetical protein
MSRLNQARALQVNRGADMVLRLAPRFLHLLLRR